MLQELLITGKVGDISPLQPYITRLVAILLDLMHNLLSC